MDASKRHGSRLCRTPKERSLRFQVKGSIGQHVPSHVSSDDFKLHFIYLSPSRHHFVESLHFMTAQYEDLHPAVAVVQTPTREYYVLRDNGMQIGCEEEGVAEIWMQIIRCDSEGRAL